MSENIQEQEQEIEILKSIYPDEIIEISNTCYEISIALDCACPQIIILNVSYPSNYPESEIPEFIIKNAENTESNINANTKINKDDRETLLEKINIEAKNNLGMASVFSVVSLLKEEGENIINNKVQILQDEKNKKVAEEEAKESAKFNGTPVTKESYLEWYKKFKNEQDLSSVSLNDSNLSTSKLTGRQIFEQGLASEADDDL